MKRRKNRWLVIVLDFILWLVFVWLIISVSPDFSSKFSIFNSQFSISTAKIAFFTLLFWALTMTLSLILHSTKKGFILSLGLTIFLFLKMLRATNWLTLLLLIILTAVMLLA